MTKIGNRNLIVVDTFDEFANATDEMDFSVEDLVAYVTSLAQVFYWLNVESVWGRLGFVWDHYDGTTRQGDGHFVHTTIPFSVIPSLPDGERVLEFTPSTFSSAASGNLTILKSNWENLVRISRITNIGKNIIANIEGAPLTMMHEDIGSTSGFSLSRLNIMQGGSLYLKADFSECGKDDNIHYFRIANGGIFIVDDNNKYLNIPSKSNYEGSKTRDDGAKGTLYWKGEGPFKLEYIWRDYSMDSDELVKRVLQYNTPGTFQYINAATSGCYYELRADSMEYIVPNTIVRNGIQVDYHPFYVDLSSKTDVSHVTVDCSWSSDVMLSTMFNATKDIEITTGGDEIPHSLAPIEFVGTPTMLDLYNPYVAIDGSWPTFNASMVSKIADNNSSAYIFYPRFKDEIVKCPYTFDATGRSYFSLQIGMSATLNDKVNSGCSKNYEGEGNVVDSTLSYDIFTYDMLPSITGMHRFYLAGLNLPYDRASGQSRSWDWGTPEPKVTSYGRAFCRIPAIESDILNISGAFIPADVKVKANNIDIQNSCLGAGNTKSIYLYTTQDKNYYRFYTNNNNNLYISNRTDIDFLDFETLDDGVLNDSSISTAKIVPGVGYTYLQPYIITAGSLSITGGDSGYSLDIYSGRYFNPSYIFIKSGVSFEFTFKDQSNTYLTMANVKRIIHSIKKIGGNEEVGSITLIAWLYDALLADDPDFESYVGVTLGYRLYRQERT